MNRTAEDDDGILIGVKIITGMNGNATHVQRHPWTAETVFAGRHGCGADGLHTEIEIGEFVTVADAAVEDQTFPSVLERLGGDVSTT
jgi:hypothetical protein